MHASLEGRNACKSKRNHTNMETLTCNHRFYNEKRVKKKKTDTHRVQATRPINN